MKVLGFIRLFLPILLILGLFSASCKKARLEIAYEIIITPATGTIHKSTWFNANLGFICGGQKNQNGFIYKTSNGGLSWQKIHESKNCLYDIYFLNDSVAYACGDNLLLLKSTDKGNTWNEVTYSFTTEPFNIVPLRCIFGDEKLLMVAGGENFDNGNMLWMIDGNMKWVWHFDHEFRSGINFTHTNYWLLGYGSAFKSSDFGYKFNPQNLKDDFFTGSIKLDSITAFTCGYNGGIYKTNNAGLTWEEVLKKNKSFKNRIHFNAIYLNANKHGFAVGNDGVLFKTTNGNNWQEATVAEKTNLLSIASDKQNHVIISTANGKLIKIKM